MTKKVVSIPFKFDDIKFANDIRAFKQATGLNFWEMDILFGVPSGQCARLQRREKMNMKMETWLKVANGMDIDIRTYFVLDVES